MRSEFSRGLIVCLLVSLFGEIPAVALMYYSQSSFRARSAYLCSLTDRASDAIRIAAEPTQQLHRHPTQKYNIEHGSEQCL